MAKAFAAGDKVQWKNFYSKKIECGTIEEIIRESNLMFIRMNAQCAMTAKKRNGKWYAYRGDKGYLERISRVT